MTVLDQAGAGAQQIPRNCYCGWAWGYWKTPGQPHGHPVWQWARVQASPGCPWHRRPL